MSSMVEDSFGSFSAEASVGKFVKHSARDSDYEATSARSCLELYAVARVPCAPGTRSTASQGLTPSQGPPRRGAFVRILLRPKTQLPFFFRAHTEPHWAWATV